MLGLPVWFWVIVTIIAVPVIALWLFISRFRKMCRAVRGEIGACLTQKYPEMEVVGERQGNLVLRNKEGAETVWEMADIYTAVGRLPGMGRDPQARAPIYEHAVKLLMNPPPDTSEPLSLVKHGPRIKPHLVRPEFLTQSFSAPEGAPHVPLPGLGLAVAYVVHLPDGYCYLSEKDRSILGIDAAEMHRLALANLRDDFPRQMVADVLAGKGASVIQAGDWFDAARLLLIPECLQGEEELIALIPHRDMLVLLPASMRQEHDKIEQGLTTLNCDDHPPFLDRPVRVTPNGFEMI